MVPSGIINSALTHRKDYMEEDKEKSLKNEYYDVDIIDQYNAHYNVIFGKRSNGKTYSILKKRGSHKIYKQLKVEKLLTLYEAFHTFSVEYCVDQLEILINEKNETPKSDYEIFKADKNTYVVQGGKVARLASVTDVRNTRQVIRLQNILTNMGVFEELKAKGAKDGDTVVVSHVEFIYYEQES